MAKVTLDKNGLAKSAVTLTIYNFNAVAASLLAQTKSIWRRVVAFPLMPASPRPDIRWPAKPV